MEEKEDEGRMMKVDTWRTSGEEREMACGMSELFEQRGRDAPGNKSRAKTLGRTWKHTGCEA